MKRNAILTTILVFVCLSNIFSQCNDPAGPGLNCQSALAFCNNELDGYCSSTYNSGVGTVVNMPPFCGSVQNNQWLQFVAGTSTISLEFTVNNCANGDGLQAMVMHSDDCINFTGVSNCYTAATSGGGSGTNIFTLDANDYTIGETYYIMLDGWLGDYCDFSIQVLQGSTSVPPLVAPISLSGLSTVCPGANSITYSIPPVAYATGYNWTLPAGTSHILSNDELSVTVDFSTSAVSGNICVEAFNDCETGSQTCFPITVQLLAPTSDIGEYCAGETFFYSQNNTNYTEGTYYVTLPGASYMGCDSTVMLEVIEKPIKETFLMETICQGEMYEVGGIYFNQTNASHSVSLTSYQGCDSTVYLDLTVLNPEVILQEPAVISCNNPDVFINGALSNADTYYWSTPTGNIISGQGTPLITVDAGGVYNLEVVKTHLGVSCTASASVTVSENYQVPTIILNSSNISCNGNNDGSASVTASGGVPPYTYAWSNGESTSTINNLIADNYTVTVAGSNGCEAVQSVFISESSALNFDIVLQNVSCHGSANGTASINASGGMEPYSYLWNTGSVSNIEAGLAAGNYALTISDANGCSIVETFEIFEPAPIAFSTSIANPLCQGESGAATVIASGGTGVLSYLWSGSPVQTTPTASGLSAGLYTVIITDQSGCSEVVDVNIIEPTGIQLNISGTDLSCFNSANGSATITASGGIGSLSYEWNTAPAQHTSSITDLEAGYYEVTVTDENNCSEVASIDLIEPEGIDLTINTQDVFCFGNATGTASVSVIGGTAPFTYIWDDFNTQNTATANGLNAGSYTVTVTDANNCTSETIAIINQPLEGIVINSTSVPATCGSSNGAFDLNVFGGTAPYVFEWTNGIPAIEDPSGLGAGTYTVVVTDNNGCSANSSLSINTSTGLEAMVDISNATCYGAFDGSMDVTVMGGAAPYTFNWNNPVNNGNEDFLNIPANEYTVTVTDNDGCSVVATGIVEQPVALTGTATPGPATCGGTDGSIDLVINGGTGPYDFDWNLTAYDGMQNLSDLFPGYYSVLVTDANGCSLSLAADVIVPNGPTLNLTGTDAGCNGENSASLDLTVTGGMAPYSYSWNNGLANIEDHNNIPAGSYEVTVTDLNNCYALANLTVSEPEAITVDMDFNNINCYGGSDGQASATVTGGMAPYTYSWSNGQTGDIATGLSSELVYVTVTDANNCSVVNSITVTQSPRIEAVYTVSNPSCSGEDDAAIDLIVTGGVGAYNFDWSNGFSSEDQNNIGQGNYAVTISDSFGCILEVDNIIIADPEPISVVASSSMASCNIADGAIDLTVNGGSGAYTFSWSDGLNAVEDPVGLNSGFYTVTVSDTNGCSVTSSVTVNSPSDLSALATSVDALCFGETTGAIEVTISGGMAPFNYSWDNTNQTVEDPSGLSAGNYILTVTDANNCMVTTSALIAEPDQIEVLMSPTEATCGEANGAISVSVNGGSGSYTYAWSNGAITEDPTALAVGNYEVTVTDTNGCTATNNIDVQAPNQLMVTAIATDALCNGDNSGSLSLTTSGGLAPYTYNWSNGIGAIQNPVGLSAGQYTVTVTDDLGCAVVLNTEISEPEPVNSIALTSHESCGNSNGAIDMTITGGTPPYNFQWQDGIGFMEDPSGLSAGVYSVTVTDANSCEYIATAEVLPAPPYFINAFTTGITCNGEADADINLNVEGGVPPYFYNWNSGQTTEDISDVSGGLYVVTVTDIEGCTVTYEVEVVEPPLLEAFLIEPINVTCNGLADGGIVLEVVGGTPDYSFDWNEDSLDGQQNPSNLEAGNYEVTISDLNGCVTSISANISEPSSLILDSSISALSCFGGENGAIDLQVFGGTSPYQYDWNSGTYSIEDISNVQSGQYNVVVTDANNCIETASFYIEEPDAIQVDVETISDYNGFNVSCFGEADGLVELSAEGGVAPYNFLWDNGLTSSQVSGLEQGDYNVTISDNNGCTVENQISLTSPGQITSETEILDPSCYNENDGHIIINNTSGGMAPYLYSIGGEYFSTYNQFNSLTAGNYELFVQDANGCEWSSTLEVINPNQLVVDLEEEITIQLGDSLQLEPLMNITLSELDTFIWKSRSIPDFNPWVTPVESTIYSIQIISENGCVAQDEISIVVNKDRQVYIPNVFTPNGDGNNDLFYPQFGKGINRVNQFKVFDRWGELVFEKSGLTPGDTSLGWDGKLGGRDMASGVYVYFVEVEFADGRIELYSGDVTLFK